MSDQESEAMPPPKKPRKESKEIMESKEVGKCDKNVYQAAQSNMDFTEDLNETNGEFSFPSSKYEDFVNPEEVEKLKEFQVLDEVKSNDEDTGEESDSTDGTVIF